MQRTKSFKPTILACFLGYITQAIMINFPPLLFVFFGKEYGLSQFEITLLIASNFVFELVVDMIASKNADKIGYRKLVVLAEAMGALGLVTLALAPVIFSGSELIGLVLGMIFCGIGGGLMEVLISPIVEACPTKNKEGFMSLLHSFYCWGQLGVVLISTLIFEFVSIESWQILSCAWTIIPITGLILFTFCPINKLVEEGKGESLGSLLKNKTFWLFLIMMLCAGASELVMSQWASYFAETALNVDKWVGDLFGPCMFALAMALTRVFYAKFSEKIKLDVAILISSVVCVATYLIVILSQNPVFSLIGCASCGFGCGLLWPGTFSLASKRIPNGGVLMFGVLALLGDAGCLVGPGLAGAISGAFDGDIKYGFAIALIFPVVLIIASILLIKNRQKNTKNEQV